MAGRRSWSCGSSCDLDFLAWANGVAGKTTFTLAWVLQFWGLAGRASLMFSPTRKDGPLTRRNRQPEESSTPSRNPRGMARGDGQSHVCGCLSLRPPPVFTHVGG